MRFLLFLLLPVPAVFAQVPVDLELVLAIDTSGSVDQREFELQVEGLVRGFRDPAVIAAIEGTGPAGGVAVTVIHWSSVNKQAQTVPWTVLKDKASSIAFSAVLEKTSSRRFGDSTGIGGALRFAEQIIRRNAYDGRRKSIDVSGDGPNNSGVPPKLVREMVTEEGITVNGLTILTDEPFLHHYYVEHVIGGAGSFVMTVDSYDDIVMAMRNKLLREISMNVAGLPANEVVHHSGEIWIE